MGESSAAVSMLLIILQMAAKGPADSRVIFHLTVFRVAWRAFLHSIPQKTCSVFFPLAAIRSLLLPFRFPLRDFTLAHASFSSLDSEAVRFAHVVASGTRHSKVVKERSKTELHRRWSMAHTHPKFTPEAIAHVAALLALQPDNLSAKRPFNVLCKMAFNLLTAAQQFIEQREALIVAGKISTED